VVIRELPIIAPTSADAARWGLAAAEQGKYHAFHLAMFGMGRTDPASVESAAKAAGLDLDRAKAFIKSPKVAAELANNLEMARQLGIDGTPSWVVGDQLLAGAVGKDELSKAIRSAKAK
jgi:protein-disulfide isomerase